MLADAESSNDLKEGRGTAAPAATFEPAASSPAAPASDDPTTEKEQKGENVAAAPAPESTPTAAVVPILAPTPTPEPTLAPAPEPAAVAPAPDPVTASAPVLEAENAPEKAPSTESAAEPTSTVGAAVDGEPVSFDLASLFKRSTEKKTFSMRIPDRHYQYLLVLGTMVGAGASPPDIIYNLVEQFIEKHDAQVQKAIQKQMRQRTRRP